jgi:hypothetical protein
VATEAKGLGRAGQRNAAQPQKNALILLLPPSATAKVYFFFLLSFAIALPVSVVPSFGV